MGAATVTGTARFAYGPAERHGPGSGEAQDGRAKGTRGGDAPPSASTRFALGDGPFPSGATGLIGAIDRAPDPSAAAFDLLHRRLHTSLTRQLFLLTGDLEQAERAVESAFHLAWEQWPLIAVDPDPESWLRSAAFDGARSPWQRFLPWRGRPSDPAARGAEPRPEPRPERREQHRSLLGALTELTAAQRYTVLLCDALGLGLPEAAAETQATTLATAERLDRAHAALAGTVPELAGLDPYGDGLPERLGRLLREAGEEVAVRPRRPADVRADGEKHGVRLVMGTGALVAALVLGMLVSLFPDADRFTTRPPDPPRPTVAP